MPENSVPGPPSSQSPSEAQTHVSPHRDEVPCNCRRPMAGGGGGACGGEGGRRHVFVHMTIVFGGAGEGGGHVPHEAGHLVRAVA